MTRTLLTLSLLATLTFVGCPEVLPLIGGPNVDGPPKAPKTPPTPEARQAVVDGNTAFAIDLYGKLRTQEGNLFFSPYSISTALAMTHKGARGDTATAMRKTLHHGEDVHPVFQAMLAEQLSEEKAFELRIANRLFGQKEFAFQPEFVEATRTHYGARLGEVDFANDSEGAVEEINEWVNVQTKERIPDLLDQLDPKTRLVLVNAIYFNADWQSRFKDTATYDRTFHGPSGDVERKFMHQTNTYRYAEHEDVRVIELPYDGEATMLVVLPKKTGGLAEVEKKLDAERFAKWRAGLQKERVLLAFPKLEFESRFELAEVLSELGMGQAFTSKADFSGITTQERLRLSRVVHQAFVKVDERGTEAAAATAVVAEKTSASERPELSFVADHPFLFVIADSKTDTVLFMGRVTQP